MLIFFLVARKDFGLGGGATLRSRSTEMAAAVDDGSCSLNRLGTLNLDRSLNTLVEAKVGVLLTFPDCFRRLFSSKDFTKLDF